MCPRFATVVLWWCWVRLWWLVFSFSALVWWCKKLLFDFVCTTFSEFEAVGTYTCVGVVGVRHERCENSTKLLFWAIVEEVDGVFFCIVAFCWLKFRMRCFLFFVWRFRCCRRRRWCLLTWCYLSKDGEDVPVVHAHGGEVARSVGHLPVSSLVHKVKGVEVEQGCFHYRQVRSSKKNWLEDVKYVNFSFFQKKILTTGASGPPSWPVLTSALGRSRLMNWSFAASWVDSGVGLLSALVFHLAALLYTCCRFKFARLFPMGEAKVKWSFVWY